MSIFSHTTFKLALKMTSVRLHCFRVAIKAMRLGPFTEIPENRQHGCSSNS